MSRRKHARRPGRGKRDRALVWGYPDTSTVLVPREVWEKGSSSIAGYRRIHYYGRGDRVDIVTTFPMGEASRDVGNEVVFEIHSSEPSCASISLVS
jgi:hypothetical protein